MYSDYLTVAMHNVACDYVLLFIAFIFHYFISIAYSILVFYLCFGQG